MSMSNSMYGYRACHGHFHVTCMGDDLIGGRFETEDEARKAADLLNQGAGTDSVLIGTDAPRAPRDPQGGESEALINRVLSEARETISAGASMHVTLDAVERMFAAALRSHLSGDSRGRETL